MQTYPKFSNWQRKAFESLPPLQGFLFRFAPAGFRKMTYFCKLETGAWRSVSETIKSKQ